MFTLDKAEHTLKFGPKYHGSGLHPTQPDVSDTIKPLPEDCEDEATLEAEQGEVVFQPNGQLHKVLGKRHSQGGTPLNLPDGTFIFSRHKPLSISKKDKEIFSFKEGGKKNTPADLLKREVDIEHHNRMIAIQGSNKHDNVSKRSSELMLMKNLKKVGQVAYLQEEKKGFPQGLPEFSGGTAPIENPYVEQQEYMSKQFKYGGAQVGGIVSPQHKRASGLYGTQEWDTDSFMKKHAWYFQNRPDFDFGNPEDVHDFQRSLNLHSNENYFHNKGYEAIDSMAGQYTMNAPVPTGNSIASTRQPLYDLKSIKDAPQESPMSFNIPNPYGDTSDPASDEDVLPYEPNVPLSPAQKLSLGYLAYNAANIKKYYPKREQVSFTPVNLGRINPQPYVNAINNQASAAYQQSQGYNPIIARANNSQILGQSLDQISQTLGNVENQNVQIGNQQSMYNNQGINRTAAQNVQLDQTYYNQVQTLNQNSDNEKRFALNRLFDQYNQYRSQNDALELQLASQQTFGSVQVWQDPRTGRTSKTPVQGWIPKKQAAPLYDYNARKNSVYYTGAGLNLNNLSSNIDTISAQFDVQFNKMIQSGVPPAIAARAVSYFLRPTKYNNPYGFGQ